MRAFRNAAAFALLQMAAAAVAVAGEVAHVTIRDMAYVPPTLTVHVGDTVAWNNADFVDHTATARDGSWDVVIATGKTAQVVMNKAGVVEYFCRFHPNMTAKIEVLAR